MTIIFIGIILDIDGVLQKRMKQDISLKMMFIGKINIDF